MDYNRAIRSNLIKDNKMNNVVKLNDYREMKQDNDKELMIKEIKDLQAEIEAMQKAFEEMYSKKG